MYDLIFQIYKYLTIWLYHDKMQDKIIWLEKLRFTKTTKFFDFSLFNCCCFQVDHYLLIVWQSFPSSHFFRFCWKPVPKLIANDQNKGDRQWLGGGWWQELAMKIFTDVTDIWQQRVRRRGEDIHILMNSCPQGPHGQWLIDLYNLVSLQHLGCRYKWYKVLNKSQIEFNVQIGTWAVHIFQWTLNFE